MHPDYTLTMDDFDDDMQLDFTSQPHDYQVHESGYAFDVGSCRNSPGFLHPPVTLDDMIERFAPTDALEFEKLWIRTEPPEPCR